MPDSVELVRWALEQLVVGVGELLEGFTLFFSERAREQPGLDGLVVLDVVGAEVLVFVEVGP